MQCIRILGAFLLMQGFVASTAGAHPGALDANGCHYESASGAYHCHKDVKPNSKVNSPVKKSRENVCHDKASPNYKTIKYFIAYQSMRECLTSGGRVPE